MNRLFIFHAPYPTESYNLLILIDLNINNILYFLRVLSYLIKIHILTI